MNEKEWRMKKGGLLTIWLLILMCLLASPLFSQQTSETTNFQSIVLDSFDNPDENQWIVRGSKFINADYVSDQGLVDSELVKAWPDALYRDPPEGQDVRSLGIHAAFDRMGYNYLEIIPAKTDDSGNLVSNPIRIPGKVQTMDMWVWGSNRDFYIEAQLRDYRGIVHTVQFGNIDFRGWHNIRMTVPTSIPQDVVYVPQEKGLELVKLVLWTRPDERVNEFYVYLDQLKCFTNTFRDPFDGERLADPAYVKQLWSEGK